MTPKVENTFLLCVLVLVRSLKTKKKKFYLFMQILCVQYFRLKIYNLWNEKVIILS